MNNIKKILIAEDELLIAKVLRMQLEKLDFEVANVTDANEAFKTTILIQPDIIIMDVYLKNKTTGIEAALKLREIGNETPIIFTTGNSLTETLLQINKISNSNALSKPVEFDILLSLINKIVAI